ncbi:MAG: archaetidylserine decarboxylase [Gammaproteobacteria bacterium]|nr:archaetidylserine decarboxylase [Gammaproteobacteria bacterium]MDH4314800.1 archaetidylserine decarboxylase [Gammaproteobacteria bacterium]MDH5213075.1 archaetidylserine decarboxylase [Gammaproteobacteria bacterium]MDH5500180.1 archaetidylserine decarboxylase [Gammaproteobacteria bacterium]
MTDRAGKAFVLLQRILPKHLMTSAIHWLAGIRAVPVKNWLISRFASAYDVDLEEVLLPVPEGFASFNEFFTRELATDARPIEMDPQTMASPVDGTVSAAGRIDGKTLIQAKGITYSLPDLLATDLAIAEEFVNGSFATIYLAPYNYHRVHCPLDAELRSALYVPGALYSVNEKTVAGLPGLFTGNERLVCRFRCAFGPMIVIFVGALHVGSISTPWTGKIRPQKSGVAQLLDLQQSRHSTELRKGDLLGWFNMGSTVILLLPERSCQWHPNLLPGSRLRMGEGIASVPSQPS